MQVAEYAQIYAHKEPLLGGKMTNKMLQKESLSLIISGVGGQGNVLIAFLLGKAMLRAGFSVTVSDTYGMSQRGGAVASHVKISREPMHCPLIPEGRADIILSMEPIETLRALVKFGNSNVQTITNIRPVYPLDVISGDAEYPDLEKVIAHIKRLSARWWLINAADEAAKLGSPILANAILMGALIGSGLLPLDEKSLEPILRESFSAEVFDANITALNRGIELIMAGKEGRN